MKSKNIEVEGGEIAIRNKKGDVVIIPKEHRNHVTNLINTGCHSCVSKYVSTLPVSGNKASNGIRIPSYRSGKIKKYANGGDLVQDKTSFGTPVELGAKLNPNINFGKNKGKPTYGKDVTDLGDSIGLGKTNYNVNVPKKSSTPSYSGNSFGEAFAKARKELGANKVFTYNGKLFTTNYADTTTKKSTDSSNVKEGGPVDGANVVGRMKNKTQSNEPIYNLPEYTITAKRIQKQTKQTESDFQKELKKNNYWPFPKKADGGTLNTAADITSSLGGLASMIPGIGGVIGSVVSGIATPIMKSIAQGQAQRSNTNKMYSSTQMLEKGGMIKRKDGSYSKRGLWDNIRANKGSGRKPTSEMLKQERKIRKMSAGGTLSGRDDLTMYKGRLHRNGGIMVSSKGTPTKNNPSAEVEHNETRFSKGDSVYIFSDKLLI